MGFIGLLLVVAIVYLSYWIGLFISHLTFQELRNGQQYLRGAYFIINIVFLLFLFLAFKNMWGAFLVIAWIIIMYYLTQGPGSCMTKNKWGWGIVISVMAAIVYSSLEKADSLSLTTMLVIINLLKASISYPDKEFKHFRTAVKNRAAVLYFLLLAWFLSWMAWWLITSVRGV